ncbi:hypothetical protein F5X96DRAFT_523095 [Biscogniauxia mediterranea]|nr:hypothetical protein F5X96DRAFT_523095 [Biscogniauxia mediterranea]
MARGERASWSSRSASPPPPYSQAINGGHRGERTPLISRSDPKNPKTHQDFPGLEDIVRVIFGFALWALLFTGSGYLGFLLLSYIKLHFGPPPVYSVAIIGAGPAGIAAAYQLKSSSPEQFDITIFETAPRVGGQLVLTNSNGGLVFPHDDPLQDPITAEDATGSALLYTNPLFTKDSERILRDRVVFTQLDSHEVKYYSGERSVTETTRPYDKTPTWSWLGLIWRYGAAVWQAGGMVRDGNLRDKITKAPLSPDVKSIMESLGVVELAQEWAVNQLGHRGIGGSYCTEVLEPQIRRTLGHRVQEVNSLAMLMATAQEDMENSFSGGDLAERLEHVLHTLDVDLRTETKVTGLKYAFIDKNHPAWLVQQERKGGTTSPQYAAFDKVILATYNEDLVRQAMFGIREYDKDAEEMTESVSGLFKPAYITFFTSTKQSETWHGAEQFLFLDTNDKESFYSSVHEFAFVRAIPSMRDSDGRPKLEYLYRLLSDVDVTEHLRQDPAITWMHQKRIENAYPFLLPVNRFPQFKVPGHSLWWTSVINTVGNTIDLNWLAGKSVGQDVIRDVQTRQNRH